MKTYIRVIMSVAVIAIMALIITMIIKGRNTQDSAGSTETLLTSPATEFTWRYEQGTEDGDGLLRTIVFLDVTYQNGKVVEQMIEEVQGSCNAIDPKEDDSDMLNNTTKIQCYAAGFGEQYKITKADNSYSVLRKHIEEGNPESAPVVFKYEEVSSIPLFQ